MGIETVGGIKNILKQYDAESWKKSADLKLNSIEAMPKLSSPGLRPVDPSDGQLSFGEILAKSLTEVNDLQNEANKAIQSLVAGKSKNLDETMLAVEKADIAFKTMNQIRLKVIDAYKEVMRMQV